MASLPTGYRFGSNLKWPYIHTRTSLSDVEKLAYLRNALKDGSAKGIIEGLSTSGNFYPEAIRTLKEGYNRPRLILQSHVRAILEAPALKDGGGREIRNFMIPCSSTFELSMQCLVHP